MPARTASLFAAAQSSRFFPFLPQAARYAVASLVLLVFLLCGRSASAGAAAEYPVAMRTFGVWAQDSHERFDFSVWYPGSASQSESAREGWIVESGRRGRVIPGFYPIILLSHDTASGRFANNDLASALAAGGFIVIVPTHMGDNQNDSADLYTARLLRARPRHLLRALETVLDSPDFALYADESRIGLIGVGFGTITALQLAGAVPDPAQIARYCPDSVATDAFCAPWAADRLAHLAPEMKAMEKKEGRQAFVPPLALYAPELVPAPPVAAVAPAPPERQKPSREAKGGSFLSRLFGGKDEGNEDADSEETGAVTLPVGNSTAAIANNGPVLDFQGGPDFGGTDSGERFVHIALSDSPHFRVTVAEESGAILSPDAFSAKSSGPLAHRRPPGIRRIRGIAMLAPAGGMLFSREALADIRIPVALVEAGQDALYPPRVHAQPFYSRLPAPSDHISLAGVDHFSLFARCSKDTMANLGEACGRLVGDQREAVAGQRDRFLLSFFHAVLGEPLPPAAPSGFVATHHNQ